MEPYKKLALMLAATETLGSEPYSLAKRDVSIASITRLSHLKRG